MDAHRRTAFTAALLLDRRQQQGGGGSRLASSSTITGVALSQGGQRLYLGLEDGVLEEHAIHISAQGARASLAARKHAAKRAVVGIHHLASNGGGPALLVLLTEDGSVLLLDGDSLEGRPLPLRHAVATCIATPPGRPPRLAVALKPGKKALRFVVYELQPNGGSGGGGSALPHAQLLAQTDVPDSSTAVHGMGWVGGQLAVCAGMRYLLVSPFGPAPGGSSPAPSGGSGVQWRELFSVPEELAYSPAMLATMPDLGRALLVVGPAGIVVDAAGNPVGSALPLESLGATPRALAASGAFLLVVSEGGIHVFDRQSGSEVQRLGFGPALRPLPGQPLYAATADGEAAGPAAGSGGGAAAAGGTAGAVAVAGRRLVWLGLPVSAADQTRELLSQRDYEAALELIEGGLLQGAPWAQVAAAQAALLLLHECRFEEAVSCLERVSPATFQPAQLFPLFPRYTAPWVQQVLTHQRYWGLHAQLPSLEALISRKLDGHSMHQPANGSSGPVSPAGLPPGSSRSSLFALDSSSAGTESPLAASPPAGGNQQQQQQQQGEAPPPAQQAAGQNGGLQPPAAEQQQLGEAQRQAGCVPDERQRLQRRAWEALAQYLFRVRMLEGVTCLPGIDTLLLLLLADLGDARQVAAFAAIPNQVDVAAVAPRLQAEQWHHALATLHAARGAADTALHIWRQVADGQLAAPAEPAVQAAERREALESAAAVLRDPEACPESTLVSYIPWLLGASQPAALAVLTARSLTPAAVLPLLPPESDVRWQYLAHLVTGNEGAAGSSSSGSSSAASDPALHTELATQLAAAIQRAEPALRSPLPPGSSPLRRQSTRRSSAGGGPGRTPRRSSSAGGGSVPRRRLSRLSTAALVSGGSLEPWEGASAVDAMRLRLRAHLEASSLYDASAVLSCLQGSGLHEELVVLHSKLGDHMAALRLLALTLHDVAAAEAYARAHLPPSDYRALLHLLLDPGPGLEPRWDDACYLIAALGDHLDPQEVLQALPPGMPLAAAAAVLAPMMRDRLHRRRQSCVVKNLHRSRLAAAAGTLCDAQDRRVVVDEERACPHCHLRLGGKVFVVLQPGMLPAAEPGSSCGGGGNGAGAAGVTAAAAGGGGGGRAGGSTLPLAHQQQQQQQPQHPQQEPEEPESLRPPGNDGLAAAVRRLQQQLASGQAPQVLCYACYRRLAGSAGAGSPASSGVLLPSPPTEAIP